MRYEIKHPHTKSDQEVISALASSQHGLTQSDAAERLQECGSNTLPQKKLPGIFSVFIRQFASPLIYILVVAALFSVLIEEWTDAIFISAVLLINAIIGTIQESSAQRSATALQQLVTTFCKVLREGDTYEIDAEQLIPGDIVILVSGDRIPADVRLLSSNDLEIDESLLTGESDAVLKKHDLIHEKDTPLSDRKNMAFAGSLVVRGRARSIVVGTALNTELGKIAEAVLDRPAVKPPLLIRMEQFTHRVSILVIIAVILLAVVAMYQGMPINDIFFLTVALAVSAIPEGLPVAITVALAIGMRRMAKRHVIIRRLIAVEALGSCTFIATDKTGTLTINQLTASFVAFPEQQPWEITGDGLKPNGSILTPQGAPTVEQEAMLEQLCRSAVLANDGFIGHGKEGWVYRGSAVDVALLIMAHKNSVLKDDCTISHPELSNIPFESDRLFSASLNSTGDKQTAHVKGAIEKLLPMCDSMLTESGRAAINKELVMKQVHALADQGYRIIALAAGDIKLGEKEVFSEEHLNKLTFIGLVAMIDPLRPDTKQAVAKCFSAGIEVAMVTGDHPSTALAIARSLKLADSEEHVITGRQLHQTSTEAEFDALTRQARVFARVEPQQKLDIVQSLQRNGHFVAVSGDGANDAPALRAAQVGVAMGESGTDVARETADIILTDDNFSSIIAGIEEGRVAYANVRKVIFLLISTGAAEIVLFMLALLTQQPLPLLAVQLLWLNLVTNGIQDVALAFEPAEGDELKKPPRPPKEGIFNRLMIQRVFISALAMGIMAYLVFTYLLNTGVGIDQARNSTLLLMVLLENVNVFNSRSETRSAFRHNPMRNRLLLFGTLAAQLIHIGAMYTPGLSDILRVQPVTFDHWVNLLSLALTLLLIMEIDKFVRNKLGNSA
jgi:magnesium-transporting ATPase (P-type)